MDYFHGGTQEKGGGRLASIGKTKKMTGMTVRPYRRALTCTADGRISNGEGILDVDPACALLHDTLHSIHQPMGVLDARLSSSCWIDKYPTLCLLLLPI